MNVDGTKISNEIKAKLKQKVKTVPGSLKLALVYAGDDLVIDSFISIKSKFAKAVGVEMDVVRFPSNVDEEEIIKM